MRVRLLGALPHSYEVTPESPTGDERQNKGSQPSLGRQRLVLCDAGDEVGEVAAGEGPLERRGDLVVVVFEGVEALEDRLRAVEVVRGQDLALDHGEDDLDLVQPGGVKRQVHEHEVGPLALEALDAALAADRSRPGDTVPADVDDWFVS